jgi:hypothetical protein
MKLRLSSDKKERRPFVAAQQRGDAPMPVAIVAPACSKGCMFPRSSSSDSSFGVFIG